MWAVLANYGTLGEGHRNPDLQPSPSEDGFPRDSASKESAAMRETWVRSLGWEDPLEEGKATHSSILAWRIPQTIIHGVTKSRTWLSNFHFQGTGKETVTNLSILDTFSPLISLPMCSQFSMMGLQGPTGGLSNPFSHSAWRNISPDWEWISYSPKWHWSHSPCSIALL